jgi:hypothetical protein
MTLPYDVYSPDQISALTMELRRYIGARQDASRRSDHGASSQLTLSAQLSSLLESSGDITAQQLLEELEAVLKNAPTVHIITGGPAGNQLKHQITAWFRDNIHPSTLVDFAFRHDLGGGVVVRAGSRIYDFSLKRRIMDNRHRISELAFGAAPVAQAATTVPKAPERTAGNV